VIGNLLKDPNRFLFGWGEETTIVEAPRVLPRCFQLEQRWVWLLHHKITCDGHIRVSTLQGVFWETIILGGGRRKEANWCFGRPR
jgi:hypothetical protein